MTRQRSAAAAVREHQGSCHLGRAASAGSFAESIDLTEGVEQIVIDVSAAHFSDISAVGALDRVMMKARRHDRPVALIGLNAASSTMVERFAAHRNEAAVATVH